MSVSVLDASAVIALLRNERGADIAADYARGSFISTVNAAEVLQRMLELEVPADAVLRRFRVLEIHAVPLSLEQAEVAATLRATTRHKGLALGDRVCLALALERGLRAVTAEATWLEVDTGVEVLLIRERQR